MIGEVRELKDGGDLLDHYRECYTHRYHCQPILTDNGVDQTLAKDLVRKFGLQTAKDLVTKYLKMDEWIFTQKRHTLSVLKKEINVVYTEVKKNETKQTRSAGSIRVRVEVYCDSCGLLEKKDLEASSVGLYFACDGCKARGLHVPGRSVRVHDQTADLRLLGLVGREMPVHGEPT